MREPREIGPPRPREEHEVVVVGGGPVGLWLAHELALTGLVPLVIERDEERSPHSKALGVHARTIEVLAMRGRHREMIAAGRTAPQSHFGMLESLIDFRSIPTPFPFMLIHPQAQTERLIERHAVDLGAVVRRGHTVTGLVQDDSSVALEVTGPEGGYGISAHYVVGADGAGSTVRREAGIGFPGTDSTVFGFLGDVILDDPPQNSVSSAHTSEGNLIVVPLPDGRYRVAGYDPAIRHSDTPVTLDDLRGITMRIAGTDFGMRQPSWISVFGNATRIASAYRDRRVLLAGDAAHIHFPTGGVGLNAGLQDAMNLGWKLAAVAQGRARAAMLDSYHEERHAVGMELAEHTMAQTALLTGLTPEARALRGLLSDAMANVPSFARLLAGKLSGLDTVYRSSAPGAHPLDGARAYDPDGEDILALLHDGRAVLLVTGSEPLDAPAKAQAAAAGITVRHRAPAKAEGSDWSGVTAALIRPDGHVWWATDQPTAHPHFSAAVRTALQEFPATF